MIAAAETEAHRRANSSAFLEMEEPIRKLRAQAELAGVYIGTLVEGSNPDETGLKLTQSDLENRAGGASHHHRYRGGASRQILNTGTLRAGPRL
jgi:hypothetical protein